MTAAALLLGIALLLAGGTALVAGASRLATRLGVSPGLVGLTILAFGTSAPELVVNIIGAARNETSLAFGNIAGSNLANLGLVLGVAAIMRPVDIQGQLVRRELPLLLLVTAILAVMVMDRALSQSESLLSRSDGLILLLLFSIVVYLSVGDFLGSRQDPLIDNIAGIEEAIAPGEASASRRDWLMIAGGMLGLLAGGQLTIVSGAALATLLGVPPVVVGLLVLALGTSMPELVTSVIAAMRREADLCVGNVIGSNLFNLLFVLPITALVRPLPIPAGGLVDVLVGLGLAAVVVALFLIGRARMGRTTGALFLVAYCGYMTYRIVLPTG